MPDLIMKNKKEIVSKMETIIDICRINSINEDGRMLTIQILVNNEDYRHQHTSGVLLKASGNGNRGQGLDKKSQKGILEKVGGYNRHFRPCKAYWKWKSCV